MSSTEKTANRSAARSMTVEEILERALAVSDTEGLHSLTIRRLANETGLGTMTLYNYFSNKSDLLQNMADFVLSRFQAPSAESISLKDYIRRLTHGWHQMMLTHPTIVQLILQQVTTRPAARQASFERPIADLTQLGLTGGQAVRVYGFTVTYALGFTAYQLPRPWGHEPSPSNDVEEQRRQQSLLLQSHSIHDYPTMVANADSIVSLPTLTQFDWGLEIFLKGLEEWIEDTPT